MKKYIPIIFFVMSIIFYTLFFVSWFVEIDPKLMNIFYTFFTSILICLIWVSPAMNKPKSKKKK